jgi:hypothetical protein
MRERHTKLLQFPKRRWSFRSIQFATQRSWRTAAGQKRSGGFEIWRECAGATGSATG